MATVRDRDRLIERIAFIQEKTKSVALVEEFIEGREIYVGVFGNELLTALPPWELTMNKLLNPQIAKNEDFSDSAEHADMQYEELLQKLVTLGLSYEPRP